MNGIVIQGPWPMPRWTPRRMTPAQRRGKIYDGLRIGLTVRQLARYLEVSESTIRRNIP